MIIYEQCSRMWALHCSCRQSEMRRIGYFCVNVCLGRSATHLLRIQPDLQAAPVASGGVCSGQMGRQHRHRGAIEPGIQTTQVLLYCRLMLLSRLSAAHRWPQICQHISYLFVKQLFRKIFFTCASRYEWVVLHTSDRSNSRSRAEAQRKFLQRSEGPVSQNQL